MDFQVKLNKTPSKEAPMCKELLQLGEGKVLEETVIAMVIEDHIQIKDPLTEEGIQMEVGDPLTEEDTQVEDLLMVEDPQEEDILIEMGNPLEEEDTLEGTPNG